MEHDRCSVTRQPINEAKRRVRKAPWLGGTVEKRRRFTICNPPPFYGPPGSWLRKGLRKRARDTMDTWPAEAERAEIMWGAQKKIAVYALAERERIDGDREDREEDCRMVSGGKLDGEVLPPMRLLTVAEFRQIQARGWGISADGWTIPVIQNQLRLRNLRVSGRTARESRLLASIRPKITGQGEKLILSGNKAAIIERLKLVVEAEAAAREADAAAVQAEVQANRDSQHHQRASRSGRGHNPNLHRDQ
jgi:hypothetical protein